MAKKIEVDFAYDSCDFSETAKTITIKLLKGNIGTLPILFHQTKQEIWEVSLYFLRLINVSKNMGVVTYLLLKSR